MTLTRLHDPVVLRTDALAPAVDRRTERYRVFRVRGGQADVIPFQFDARDDEGDVVLSASGGEEPFVFDGDDELVFMAKDVGDRARRSALPAGADTVFEIEVTDPVDGRRGWAYLAHFSGEAPPLSPVRYATFDPKTNIASATFYHVSYATGRNVFTGVRISPAGGGNGENLLDGMTVTVRPTLSLLLTDWTPTFDERSFVVALDGFKNGPVRAIRRVRQSLDLGKFFPQGPNGTVYTYYYFGSFITPSVFSIPWVVLHALRSFEFKGIDEFGERALGMRYWDGANPQGLRFGGGGLGPTTDGDHDWWAVSGAGGTCLHAFVIPERWRQWGVVRGTAFTDEAGGPGKAGRHAAGFSLLNMTNIREPGSYEMNLAVMFLPKPYEPGDERQPLAMLNAPLRVGVRTID